MDIKDCLPDGAGTCRNEAMIEGLQAAREADWRRFVELTHDEQIAELERRWQQAEAWSRLWKRTAKTRRAWLIRYKERLGKAAEEDARLRAALLAAMNVIRHVPHGQSLTDGETVELETAVRLASEALEGAA